MDSNLEREKKKVGPSERNCCFNMSSLCHLTMRRAKPNHFHNTDSVASFIVSVGLHDVIDRLGS